MKRLVLSLVAVAALIGAALAIWPKRSEQLADSASPSATSAPSAERRADDVVEERESAPDTGTTEAPTRADDVRAAEPLPPLGVWAATEPAPFTLDRFKQLPGVREMLAEPRDPEWSAEMERRILTEISDWKRIPYLELQADCRTSFCAVAVTHPPGTDPKLPFQEAEWLLHELNMGPRPFWMGKGPGDTVQGLLFLGRVDAPRPPPSAPLPID